jgi:hypothetical protein
MAAPKGILKRPGEGRETGKEKNDMKMKLSADDERRFHLR